jgi:hypothetical protein
MDFDEMKRPTRDFNIRGTKLGQEDRQAIQNARDERDRGKEAENTNYEKNRDSLIQKKADELAEEQRPGLKHQPPGLQVGLKSRAQIQAEATEHVVNRHERNLAQFDAKAKQTEDGIYERQYAQRMRDKLDARLKEPTKAMDAGVNQQEQSKFVGSAMSAQQNADARSKEPTKVTAQVGADANEQQQGNSVDRAANMREQFNNAAQKKSKFVKM